jgi:hypothetical protein
MDWKLVMYLVYVTLSVALTVWVGRSLYRNGRVFLINVFAGDRELAGSVNHLLVVGFYLINLGFVALALRTGDAVATATGAVELLSRKMGLVLLVLGVIHLGNVFVLNRMRRRATERQAPRHPVFPPPNLAQPVMPQPAPPAG